MTTHPMVLHGSPYSGHVHRVVLLLRALGLEYEWRDTPGPARRTPEFLRLNPHGQVPVLEHAGQALADSNAILVYLALRYDGDGLWYPRDAAAAAAVQRWLSIAAGELMYGPAKARMVTLWNMEGDVAQARGIAARLLPLMERHLAGRLWLASADHPTIADLACYAYVAHAPDGRISLDGFGELRGWLRRIEALDFFVPIPPLPIPDGAP
jgi:glutathione S-transferase